MSLSENEEKALKLSEEMHGLLEKWLGKDGPECNAAIQRVGAIKKEINSFGFWVDWLASMKLQPNPDDNKFEVTVTVSRPRPDLTPQEKEIYDIWFKQMNGMK
ncbi:MAG: hypothetical protein Q7S83_02025 [bacterium]|nr:hypothetical protein [bacterium]